MKTTHLAFVALAVLLTLTPLAEAATDLPAEEACVYREERCPMGYGTVIVVCKAPIVRVPLCFI